MLADARDKVCMLHYVCLGSKEYELCHQINTSLFPTPEHNPPLLADSTSQETKLIDNSKSEPYIPVADPPHGASKASLPHEVATCPPAAPYTAAPSDPSQAIMAPILNPTSGEPPKNLATRTSIGIRTDEVGEERDAMNLMDINENSSSRQSTRNDNRNALESIGKSELVRVMQQHEAIGRTERKVQDIGVWYPDEYVGLQKCHFRSLYCVCPERAKKAF